MIFTPTYTQSTYPRRSLVTVNFQLALASAIAKERKKLPSSSLLATPCLFAHPFVMQHLLESAEKHETRGNMSSACEINAKFVLQEIGWSEMRRNIKRWLCVRYITLKDSLYRETFHIWSCMLSNLQMFACALSSARRSRGKRFHLLRTSDKHEQTFGKDKCLPGTRFTLKWWQGTKDATGEWRIRSKHYRDQERENSRLTPLDRLRHTLKALLLYCLRFQSWCDCVDKITRFLNVKMSFRCSFFFGCTYFTCWILVQNESNFFLVFSLWKIELIEISSNTV